MDATISAKGIGIKGKPGWNENVYAIKGFPISDPDCRADNFPGTICYYYEVKLKVYLKKRFGLKKVA
jgi:hypothetical protein